MTMTAPSSGAWRIARIVQALVRAKPCCGAFGLTALGPNHGKISGTPPRIALAGSNRLWPLMNSTGLCPRGW
jgi:hypothetical protein